MKENAADEIFFISLLLADTHQRKHSCNAEEESRRPCSEKRREDSRLSEREKDVGDAVSKGDDDADPDVDGNPPERPVFSAKGMPMSTMTRLRKG